MTLTLIAALLAAGPDSAIAPERIDYASKILLGAAGEAKDSGGEPFASKRR